MWGYELVCGYNIVSIGWNAGELLWNELECNVIISDVWDIDNQTNVVDYELIITKCDHN